MNRRAWLILILVAGVAAILFVLYWLLAPVFQGSSIPVETSSTLPLPTSTGTGKIILPPKSNGSTSSAPVVDVQPQEALKQMASSFAARSGSYSSVDGFAAIKSVYPEATQSVRDFLEADRVKLVKAHPSTSASFGQTRHVLAVRLSSPTPFSSRAETAEVVVQAQERIESAGQTMSASYVEITLSLQKQNGAWIVSRLSSKPLDL